VKTFKATGKTLTVSVVVIAVYAFVGLVSSLLAPFEYNQVRVGEEVFGVLAEPNQVNIWGTTSAGFDVFSRTLLGTSTALTVALLSVALAGLIGIVAGLVAGLMGGPIDKVLSGIADAFYAIPSLLIALVVSFALSDGSNGLFSAIAAAVIAEGITFSTRYFRAVRIEAITVARSRFVESARVSGISNARMLLVHILPNSLKTAPVLMVQNAADAVLTLSGLGFLGIGISANSGAEWGYDIARAIADIQVGIYWTSLFPGIAVAILVIALMLVAEGLSDRDEQRSSNGL
jgi:peptide/nickel transport system permease protein